MTMKENARSKTLEFSRQLHKTTNSGALHEATGAGVYSCGYGLKCSYERCGPSASNDVVR